MRQRIILYLCAIILPLNGLAKTIEWGIAPEYDDLKPYSEEVCYYSKDGKWGLIRNSGEVILNAQYDFITGMTEGYAIAGVKDGSKNRISCIIDDSYNVENLSESYYLVNKYYTYFSDSKLPVANKAGKQGFINTEGKPVIKCQFDNVHPFSNGYASVSKYPKAFYITDRYDASPKQSVLPIEFNYGDITFASTFYNGKAVVAYNNKSAVINLSGKKVEDYKGKINSACYNKFDYTIKDCGSVAQEAMYQPTTDGSITAYSENGLYGYINGNAIIVYPSFNEASNVFTNGYAVVKCNNKFGLIRFIDGDVNSFVAKATGTTPFEGTMKTNGKENYSFVVALPNSVSNASDYSVSIDNGVGSLQPASVNIRNGIIRANLSPRLSGNVDGLHIAAEIQYKGVVVGKYNHTFAVKRDTKQINETVSTHQSTSQHATLKISGPMTKTERANEKDIQTVLAVISNPTGKSVTVTLSIPSKNLSTKCDIPAGGRRTIHLDVKNVKKTENVSAVVTSSTGISQKGKITLKPYY